MELVRGLGKFLGSIIFPTLLVISIMLIELVGFTSYDNFKLLTSDIVEKQLLSVVGENQLSDLKSFLLFQCAQTDRVNVPFLSGQSIVVKCDEVKNSSESQLPALISTALIDSLYYKKFDCSFTECIKSGNPLNLLIVASNEGNQFYRNLQTWMWIGTAAGLALLIVSIKTWAGRLKGVGFNLVFTGLPFLFLGYIQSAFMPALPSGVESSVKPVIDSLLSSIKSKFMIVLVVGIALVVVGYGLGFYLSRKRK